MNLKSILALAALAGCLSLAAAQEATLTYFGRATVKIVTADKFVIYVDPYAPGDYSQEADLVLVTHGHSDHNAVYMTKQKETCVVAGPRSSARSLGNIVKEGDTFTAGKVKVTAVPAYNSNHGRSFSVGYLISFDGMTVYHAGDTSFIPEMADMSKEAIDYALFPTDGYYNMGGEEAKKCAETVKARFVMAIHSSPDGMYNKANADKLDLPNAIPLPLKAEIKLSKK